MVQRKVTDKLGIQADIFISHISLRKPSSTQHQDGKTRGPEVKRKMMKKSRSFKVSDIGQQSLKSSSQPSSSSSSLRRNSMSQPGKPPPQTLHVPTVLQTPKKPVPFVAKGHESSPNYMKSTSCFATRKELQSQERVSTGKKPVKCSPRTSSSSLVRNLTKTPSFKHSRQSVSAKKSSRVALCASPGHVDVQRATCSSTLKDSKFPNYLMLNHGGTESDGTSVVKVCPYTYCSLNGHVHKHASLPPLRRFLSAKRRALKTQKSVKLAVPCDERLKEVDCEEDGEKVCADFFVEIFTEDEGNTSLLGCEEEQIVVESLSDGSPQSEIEEDDLLDRCSEIIDSVEEESAEDYDSEGSFSSQSMECEDGMLSDSEIDDEADSSSEMDEDSESISDYSSETEDSTVDMIEEHEEEIEGEESEQVYDCLIDRQLCCEKDECEEDEKSDVMRITINDETTMEEAEEINESLEAEEDVISPSEVKDQSNQASHASQETHEADKDGHDQTNEESLNVAEQVDTNDLSSQSLYGCEEIASSSDLSQSTVVEESNDLGIIDTSAQNQRIDICDGSEDHIDEKLDALEPGKGDKRETEMMEVENSMEAKQKWSSLRVEQENADQELRNKWSRNKREVKDSDEEVMRKFNPRDPNFLPLVADPEGEKVDLKHQDMDDRKNSEDWMIDHALQQAVNKLGPARKRRVALLVEAFETVTPIIKRESVHMNRHHHIHHPSSPVFQHAIRPIQACN